jgi:Gas vesicle protein
VVTVQESPLRYQGRPSMQSRPEATNLADLLERILDKGIVIAGDISISLVDIELLTIKLRLLIASVDKAREIGVNWWESDSWLSGRQRDQAAASGEGPKSLEDRMERLEHALQRIEGALPGTRGEGK